MTIGALSSLFARALVAAVYVAVHLVWPNMVPLPQSGWMAIPYLLGMVAKPEVAWFAIGSVGVRIVEGIWSAPYSARKWIENVEETLSKTGSIASLTLPPIKYIAHTLVTSIVLTLCVFTMYKMHSWWCRIDQKPTPPPPSTEGGRRWSTLGWLFAAVIIIEFGQPISWTINSLFA